MNTMQDLKFQVAQQIDETIGGHMFDLTEENLTVSQMIGIDPIDRETEKYKTEETILDPHHSFWESWYDGRVSQFNTFELVEAAIHLLVKDETVIITDVYEEDSDLVYVEVNIDNKPPVYTSATCDSCGNKARAKISFLPASANYMLRMELHCDNCNNDGVYTAPLVRE
jgi:hypothetical protein